MLCLRKRSPIRTKSNTESLLYDSLSLRRFQLKKICLVLLSFQQSLPLFHVYASNTRTHTHAYKQTNNRRTVPFFLLLARNRIHSLTVNVCLLRVSLTVFEYGNLHLYVNEFRCMSVCALYFIRARVFVWRESALIRLFVSVCISYFVDRFHFSRYNFDRQQKKYDIYTKKKQQTNKQFFSFHI